MAADRAYWKYWAVIRRESGDRANYHLLPYHCIDVAAVGTLYATPLRIDKEPN